MTFLEGNGRLSGNADGQPSTERPCASDSESCWRCGRPLHLEPTGSDAVEQLINLETQPGRVLDPTAAVPDRRLLRSDLLQPVDPLQQERGLPPTLPSPFSANLAAELPRTTPFRQRRQGIPAHRTGPVLRHLHFPEKKENSELGQDDPGTGSLAPELLRCHPSPEAPCLPCSRRGLTYRRSRHGGRCRSVYARSQRDSPAFSEVGVQSAAELSRQRPVVRLGEPLELFALSRTNGRHYLHVAAVARSVFHNFSIPH